MAEFITRVEYTQDLQRLSDRIDPINESSIRMEESSKRVEAMVKSLYTLMHGNGKDGLITKVSNLFTKVRQNSRLIYIILTSVLGAAGVVIWKTLIK